MEILTPVIGVPNSVWKKKAIKFVRKSENIYYLDVRDFCYKCDRYMDLLKMFDNNDENYKKSDYFVDRLSRGGKSKRLIIRRINNYRKMYEAIKSGDYDCLKTNCPIVTVDGCRLDGTHRLSILIYLGICKTNINVVVYEKIFSNKNAKTIKRNNLEYRQKTYNL
jgi:hypothetical protein